MGSGGESVLGLLRRFLWKVKPPRGVRCCFRYRYCTKQRTPTCKGMEFGYSDFKDKKYCPFCKFANHKSKLATGQCVAFNSRKYMERLRGYSGQWQCRKCGHVTIVLYDKPSVVIVSKNMVK